MARTIRVTIPHRLSKEEVRRRIDTGLVQLFDEQSAGQVAELRHHWSGDRMDFRLTVLRQPVTGRVDVRPEDVLIEVDLPWLLAALASRIRPQLEERATKLLEAPPHQA